MDEPKGELWILGRSVPADLILNCFFGNLQATDLATGDQYVEADGKRSQLSFRSLTRDALFSSRVLARIWTDKRPEAW